MSQQSTEWKAARAAIEAKDYDKAREILKTINHPKAREWEQQIDKIAPTVDSFSFPEVSTVGNPAPASTGKVSVPGESGYKFWRVVWGVLTLASMAWLCYGISISSSAYTTVASKSATDAGKAGAAIGASLGIGVFLCTGGLPLLFFGLLYWRNGVGLRNARRHQELIDVQRR